MVRCDFFDDHVEFPRTQSRMTQKILFMGILASWSLVFDTASANIAVVQKTTPYKSSYVFTPNDGKPHAGIVLFHGSEGGSQRNLWIHALLLAQSGFSVMTFCWWDCGRDVRSEPFATLMADIEIKSAVDAVDWFRKSEFVQMSKSLGLYGISKGAELAMLIASFQDQLPFKIGALAVHSPNDVIEKGSNINWLDSRCWVCDEGVKQCSYQEKYWNRSCGKIDGSFTRADRDSLPMWTWKGSRLKLNSRVELEKFSGSILITAGENDTDWESDRNRVKRIETALLKAGRKPEIHMFKGEGHSFSMEAEQKRKAIVDQFFAKSLK